MWKSICLFLCGVIRSAISWLSLPLFFVSAYGFFIKPLLPEEYQREYYMPTLLMFLSGIICLFFAGATAYHKLRMAKLAEFYEFSPEANGDRIFRIFYSLYKEGKFLKGSSVERRQKWDEDVLKEIKNYCRIEFEHIYLLNTGRRNYAFTPLEDENYDKALSNLKDFIDRDFDQFIKI